MTQEYNREESPLSGLDDRVFFMRTKSGMEIITIGYFETRDGSIRCACWMNPWTEHFFYSDGLIYLGKKNKFVEHRLASKSETELIFTTIRKLGFEWNKETKCAEVDLSLVREKRFNIMTDDDIFFDSDVRFAKPQPMAIRL